MGPYDTDFLLQAHADRVAALRAAAASVSRPRRPSRLRRSFARWLIAAGVRLAAEPTRGVGPRSLALRRNASR